MPIVLHLPPVAFWQDLLSGFSVLCFFLAVCAAIPQKGGVFDSWRRLAGNRPAPSQSESKQNMDFRTEVRPNLVHFVGKEKEEESIKQLDAEDSAGM